jgi:hypothetical protein
MNEILYRAALDHFLLAIAALEDNAPETANAHTQLAVALAGGDQPAHPRFAGMREAVVAQWRWAVAQFNEADELYGTDAPLSPGPPFGPQRLQG